VLIFDLPADGGGASQATVPAGVQPPGGAAQSYEEEGPRGQSAGGGFMMDWVA